MAHINPHYKKLASSYLFSEIAKRTKAFLEAQDDLIDVARTEPMYRVEFVVG